MHARPVLPALLLLFPTTALAQHARRAPAAPSPDASDASVLVAHPVAHQVRFAPGAAALDHVTFVPAHVPAVSTARSATATVPPVTSHTHARIPPANSPAPVTPIARPLPTRCALAAPVRYLDLAAAGNTPVQLTLAARGRDAVALVTLARSGGPRDGFVYPATRLVSLPAIGAPHVSPAPAFEPDASIALGGDGSVLVVHPSRRDVRGDAETSRATLAVTLLDRRGVARAPSRALPESRGLEIDSPVVAWNEGFAVVLGRVEPPHDGIPGRVREWVHTFDPHGAPVRTPQLVCDTPEDDTLGRWRTGLGALPGRDELALAWTVSSGSEQGVWTRRYAAEGGLGYLARVERRSAWGAEIAADGSGIVYRTGGTPEAPVGFAYLPWRGRSPYALGAGWDPATVFVRGRVLVAGAVLGTGDDRESLLAEAAPGERLHAVSVPDDARARFGDAVDVDLVATDDGAVLAWIVAEDSRGDRALGVARVSCR